MSLLHIIVFVAGFAGLIVTIFKGTKRQFGWLFFLWVVSIPTYGALYVFFNLSPSEDRMLLTLFAFMRNLLPAWAGITVVTGAIIFEIKKKFDKTSYEEAWRKHDK